MPTVTMPEIEYKRLKQQAKAYQQLTGKLFEFVLHDPINQVAEDFRKTHIYSEGFLKDMEAGLRKSSYGKRKR
jgi:hypothetical protein